MLLLTVHNTKKRERHLTSLAAGSGQSAPLFFLLTICLILSGCDNDNQSKAKNRSVPTRQPSSEPSGKQKQTVTDLGAFSRAYDAPPTNGYTCLHGRNSTYGVEVLDEFIFIPVNSYQAFGKTGVLIHRMFSSDGKSMADKLGDYAITGAEFQGRLQMTFWWEQNRTIEVVNISQQVQNGTTFLVHTTVSNSFDPSLANTTRALHYANIYGDFKPVVEAGVAKIRTAESEGARERLRILLE